MNKFKVGDVVTGVVKTTSLYKIVKENYPVYAVETLVRFGGMIPEDSRDIYFDVDFTAIAEPTFEQTLLLTKLGLLKE